MSSDNLNLLNRWKKKLIFSLIESKFYRHFCGGYKAKRHLQVVSILWWNGATIRANLTESPRFSGKTWLKLKMLHSIALFISLGRRLTLAWIGSKVLRPSETVSKSNKIRLKSTLNSKRNMRYIFFFHFCLEIPCVVCYRQDVAAFREFLLVKLINGEKATFQTPTFSRKRERTLEMLIKDLYEEYAHDTKTVSSSTFSI